MKYKQCVCGRKQLKKILKYLINCPVKCAVFPRKSVPCISRSCFGFFTCKKKREYAAIAFLCSAWGVKEMGS